MVTFPQDLGVASLIKPRQSTIMARHLNVASNKRYPQKIASVNESNRMQKGRTVFPVNTEAFTASATSSRSSPLTPHFEQLVQKLLKQWHAPCASIGVVDGDDIYTKVYLSL